MLYQACGSLDWNSDGLFLQDEVFKVNVLSVRKVLLAQEDTNGDGKITIDDRGPKCFRLRTVDSNDDVEIRGTYQLSTLLQELTIAVNSGKSTAIIQGSRVAENPVDRTRRRINHTFWDSLTRRMDRSLIHIVADDPKDYGDDPRPRIYVPHALNEQYEYYQTLATEYPALRLEVKRLPSPGQDLDMLEMRKKPGILALEMEHHDATLRGVQYLVPGGRFNEFYYWDSHFAALGLLTDGRLELVKDIARQMIFQIEHYGCVLNANRSYYLGRSQPPFLTDLVRRIHHHMEHEARPGMLGHNTPSMEDEFSNIHARRASESKINKRLKEAQDFLRRGILAAIKEYHHVWTSKSRLDPATGLSRYRPTRHGIPPEVEPGHFDWVLGDYAKKHDMSIDRLIEEYNSGRLKDQKLDEFFLHDAAVRESGHDTSYRVESQAANLATVDLNCLLYKYETDIAWAIQNRFDGRLIIDPEFALEGLEGSLIGSSGYWKDRAQLRKRMVDKYLWDPVTGMYHDYNTERKLQTPYESVTTFWPLWCGIASSQQAKILVSSSLPKFEHIGGVVSMLPQPEESNGPERRQRQWDYPFGWAPHQMMIWDGLKRYGYEGDAKRLAYRWLHLVTRIAMDYNGMVTERYDVTQLQKGSGDDAEYGNQGADFEGVPNEGFGWSNASYVYGLSILDNDLIAELRKGKQWPDIPASNGHGSSMNGTMQMNGWH